MVFEQSTKTFFFLIFVAGVTKKVTCMLWQRIENYGTYLVQHKNESKMGTNDETKILEWTKTKMTSSSKFHRYIIQFLNRRQFRT